MPTRSTCSRAGSGWGRHPVAASVQPRRRVDGRLLGGALNPVALPTWTTLIVAMVVPALPFLALGVLVSGTITAWVRVNRPGSSGVVRRGRDLVVASSFSSLSHVPDGLVDSLAGDVDVLEVQPTPGEAVVADPEDGDATHVQPRPIDPGAVPVPFRPAGVGRLDRPK